MEGLLFRTRRTVVRISDALEEISLIALEQTWTTMASSLGVVSNRGEFLLTIGGEGTFGLSEFWILALVSR